MCDGDRNTKFFHRRASVRRSKNRIVGLRGSNGVWYDDDAGIAGMVTDYFSDIFASNQPTDNGEILQAIKQHVTEEMNNSLMRDFGPEKIKMAIFQMQLSSSPSHDDLPPLLFQKSWVIVGDDVTREILSFLNSGNLLKKMNYTYITLISKVKTRRI